ncbi:ChrR family anti-sigma-E factor [Motilimonas pumila]|uniref:Transcriptional regulator n=1 Tax=Motilimonas pumila TaxID=2303987 RepID=A0A418YFI1_9GAMM|nr:ChrR family anti-sigma-E factor [Motilimonas pumila]RJG48130.1 transcriptional regulator [Motilimonas pumila]
MIKHHPSNEILLLHTKGELPLSLSLAVSAHIELCPECQKIQQALTEQESDAAWTVPCKHSSGSNSVDAAVETLTADSSSFNEDLSDMLSSIMEQAPEEVLFEATAPTSTKVAGKNYNLPRAFRQFDQLKWSGIGAVSRARIVSEADDVRGSLLHIDQDASIPQHSHKGYELTLLLDGTFEDENGKYERGDFIWLEGDHQHSPYTKEGCLCYAVQNAPLHFVSGVSKVLNPLGKMLY